ncbi:MAG: DUF1820 family protein [Gammaproteobacteria bacterium]
MFLNQGKVFELYAHSVSQGNLYGFVEVEELVFGEKTALVVDPSEERLRSEFTGVKRTFLPMPAVIRIDEVEQEGISKIRATENPPTMPVFPLILLINPRATARNRPARFQNLRSVISP